MKSKLFVLVLLVVFALTVLSSCVTVNAPTIPNETTENNETSTAGQDYPTNDLTDASEDYYALVGTDINTETYANAERNTGAHTDIDANNDDRNTNLNFDTGVSESDTEASVASSFVVPIRAPAARLVTSPSSMKIAITFDDGPAAYTEQILDVLEQHGGRATFFVTGSRVESNADIIKRAFNMGNEIANHSWSHARFTRISDDQIRSEIQRTSDAIRAVTGVSPPFYRPPYGSTDDRVVRVSAEMGYSIVKWTLDTLDWRHRNPYFVYRAIIDRVEPGSVILLHDIHATTAEAMKYVIPDLVAKGFELVTVSELIQYYYGTLEPGQISGWYVQ